MSKTAIEKMITEETKNLPKEKLTEILDFILFLKTRKPEKYYRNNLETELADLDKTSLGNLEEEFANYKQLYPYE